jgi:hypothetical protein
VRHAVASFGSSWSSRNVILVMLTELSGQEDVGTLMEVKR